MPDKMTLAKAIEILNLFTQPGRSEVFPDDIDAIQLGIEAIKRLTLARSYGDKHTLQKLPGED